MKLLMGPKRQWPQERQDWGKIEGSKHNGANHIQSWEETNSNSYLKGDAGDLTLRRRLFAAIVVSHTHSLSPCFGDTVVPAKEGGKCGDTCSVTGNIKYRRPDVHGNPYPPMSKCYITFSKTAKSNEDLTITYEKKVLLPWASVVKAEEFNRRILDLCNDFRGHSAKAVKTFNRVHHVRIRMLKLINTKVGLTPVGKPLEILVN